MERFLLIANPAAQSGKGAILAERAASILRAGLPEDALSVVFTNKPQHASEIAAQAEGFDAIITLGGDGAIHEVINGLMERDAAMRPALGVIPAGSGNDYARALGIPADVDRACALFVKGTPQAVDIGKVNGSYFMETLSFGLDAAIALDTMERRKKTGRKGALLYAESGIDQLLHHLDVYDYTATFDGKAETGGSITFAVQIGPYYGGGFKICPDAKVDDGTFEICISHPPITVLRAIATFLKAKSGKHVRSPNIQFLSAKDIHLEFDAAPPAQIDGEHITGSTFDISIEPSALKVIR